MPAAVPTLRATVPPMLRAALPAMPVAAFTAWSVRPEATWRVVSSAVCLATSFMALDGDVLELLRDRAPPLHRVHHATGGGRRGGRRLAHLAAGCRLRRFCFFLGVSASSSGSAAGALP